MYKRILLPTDGSNASQRAIAAGVDFAKAIGAEVIGLTAVPPFHTFTMDAAMLEQTKEEYEMASREHAQRLLDDVSNAARDAGVPCTCAHVYSDSPYEAILSTAREKACDLIVMASHGHKGLKGLLLGSETQKVLVHGSIPVMVHR
ncbi:universal stress protein [Massilia niastensis]|uniref:universal stress protein n=1 Tax=Massilia niastensis TaxID=544911 RepID=UPI000361E916|nr:universal stress protein [Massilia niastensis]